MVNQSFSRKGCEAFRAKFPRMCGETHGGLESGPERGDPASVSDHVMTSQDYYRKVEHEKTWLLSSSLAKVPTVLV